LDPDKHKWGQKDKLPWTRGGGGGGGWGGGGGGGGRGGVGGEGEHLAKGEKKDFDVGVGDLQATLPTVSFKPPERACVSGPASRASLLRGKWREGKQVLNSGSMGHGTRKKGRTPPDVGCRKKRGKCGKTIIARVNERRISGT